MINTNFGYFYWGHLGDRLSSETKNSPDGNCWYSTSIISEMQKKGTVYLFGPDRDAADINQFGKNKVFGSFCSERRIAAYDRVIRHNDKLDLPFLDVLLLEWRFAIPVETLE